MNSPLITSAALVFLLIAAAPLQAAEPMDVADLFPPNTLAYAELTNPAELSPQLAAIFKGTVLEDSIPFIHKQKDAAKTLMELQGKRELAGLGLLASPELMAEFKKLRGVAIGLVGFSSNGEPDVALVVLTGESPAAGLAARAFLTMTSSLRKIGEVSKVPIFQYRTPNINYDNMNVPTLVNDKPQTESSHDLTFAYTPGLFVAGTSKTAVSRSIKRFLGEEKGGLAGTPRFKEAAAAHRQTGVFFLVNFPEFAAQFAAANKARGGETEPDTYAWFKMIANPKAIKSFSGNLKFRDEGLAVSISASIDPTEKSPLMELLSGEGLKVDFLNQTQRPATMSFVISLPEKNRAASAIRIMDAMAKANGELGKLPSDFIKELQKKYKGSLVEELIGKTQAISVIVPSKQDLPKDTKPLPLFILHTDDAATATAWEDFLPKLISELSGAKTAPQPFSETISGIKVISFPGNGLPWNGPVHVSRNGKMVVVGLDRKLVAAAAMTSGDKPMTIPAGDPLVGYGNIVLAEVVAAILEKPRTEGPVVPVENPAAPQGFNNGNPIPEELIEALKKSRNEFFTTVGKLAPATMTVRRKGNELTVEIVQPKVQGGGLKAIIDSGALWLDRWSSLMGSQQFGFDGRMGFDR